MKRTKKDKQATQATPKSVVPKSYKQQYGKTQNCGDEVAQSLSGHPHSAIVTVGTINGIDVEKRWGHLNPGMQRMNLGNVLRAMVKLGGKVKLPKPFVAAKVRKAA